MITPSNNPNLFNTIAITAIMATTAATIKNIGFIKIVAPSFINAFPKVPNIPAKSLKPFAISLGFILARFLANTLDLSLAPSKSNDARSPATPANELLTISNLEPAVNTAACSLASFSLSATSPAFCASSSICAGSVAVAIAPFNSLNSFLI